MGINDWDIIILPQAKQDIKDITDRRIQGKILTEIRYLSYIPEQRGKALKAELNEYYSIRAANQRYRIIYRLDKEQHIIFVFSVGIRRYGYKQDIYALAKKRLRFALFNF